MDQTPFDLRRRICDAAERIAELETERFALEELRDGLEAKERDLQRRAAAVEEERGEVRAEIDSKAARAEAVAVEIDGVRRETSTLQRQRADRALRVESLARDAAVVAAQLRVRQDAGRDVEAKLEAVCDSVARMDRKLGCAARGGGSGRSTG